MSERAALRAFIEDNFGFRGDLASLSDEDSLLEAGIIDSMAVLVIIQFLEERYGITVPDEDVAPENLGSIAAIDAYITRRQGG